MHPALRFLSTAVHKTTAWSKIYAYVDKPIHVLTFCPDPSCFVLKYPQSIQFTVPESKQDAVIQALTLEEGVLSVNGQKTAYGEKVRPEFLYPSERKTGGF